MREAALRPPWIAFPVSAGGQGGQGEVRGAAVRPPRMPLPVSAGGRRSRESALAAQVVALTKKLEQMEHRLDSQTCSAAHQEDDAVAQLSRIIDTPPNLHQATVTVCLPAAETTLRTKMMFVFGSCGVVLVQMVVVMSLCFGMFLPSCYDNSGCPSGKYCHSGLAWGGLRGRCFWCNSVGMLGAYTLPHTDVRSSAFACKRDGISDPSKCRNEGGTCVIDAFFVSLPHGHNDSSCADGWEATAWEPTSRIPNYRGPNATAFCVVVPHHPACSVTGNSWEGGCWDPSKPTDTWLGDAEEDDVYKAVRRMKQSDILAMIFASGVAALQFASEVKDIKLCEILARAVEVRWAYWVLWLVAKVRQYAVLPVLAICLPILLLFNGSDTLSICFNTLAVVFVLDVDDMVFSHWLPEGTCEFVERHGRQFLMLDQTDTRTVLWTRRVYALAVPSLCVWFLLKLMPPENLFERANWPFLLFPQFIFLLNLTGFLAEALAVASSMDPDDFKHACNRKQPLGTTKRACVWGCHAFPLPVILSVMLLSWVYIAL